MLMSQPRWTHPQFWRTRAQWQASGCHAPWSWLSDTGSLTARLTDWAEGDFRVQVLQTAWTRPAMEEVRQLHLPPHRRVHVREVLLLGCDTPWVHARTLIPERTWNAAGLHRVGSQSLGAFLFRDPAWQRGPLLVARQVRPDGQVCWVRRSAFTRAGQTLFVAEAFLPALFNADPSVKTP